MSVAYIKAELRRLVEVRANGICEYCLIADADTYVGCQVDHIISLKHGGPTEANNLAFACSRCNLAKGSDIGSIYWQTGAFVRLFNPRIDRWLDHFELVTDRVEGITPIGAVTARILAINSVESVLERVTLRLKGRYLSPAAVAHLQL